MVIALLMLALESSARVQSVRSNDPMVLGLVKKNKRRSRTCRTNSSDRLARGPIFILHPPDFADVKTEAGARNLEVRAHPVSIHRVSFRESERLCFANPHEVQSQCGL